MSRVMIPQVTPPVTANTLPQIKAEIRLVNTENGKKIYIYGSIFGDSAFDMDSFKGVTPSAFTKMLDEAGGEDVELHINSGGGDVWAGISIASAIHNYAGRVDIVVDGLAASAASLISQSGDSLTMSPGSFLMIHNALTSLWGNSLDLRKMADDLDKIDAEGQAVILAEGSGLPVARIREMMDAETFIAAEEAVELGFADGVSEKKDKEDLDVEANSTRASVLALLQAKAAKPPVSPAGNNAPDEKAALRLMSARFNHLLGDKK